MGVCTAATAYQRYNSAFYLVVEIQEITDSRCLHMGFPHS